MFARLVVGRVGEGWLLRDFRFAKLAPRLTTHNLIALCTRNSVTFFFNHRASTPRRNNK